MNKEFTIEVYSHGAYIHDLDIGSIARFTPFINGLELREDIDEWDAVRQRSITKNVVKKRFFVATPGRNTFHIHRNMLDDLLEEMRSAGLTNYKRIDHEPVNGDAAEGFVINGKTPRDYQDKIINAILNNQYTCGVKLKTGGGKAHKHGTKVRAPNSWVNIEDIRVGDTVVGEDGKPTKVVGVYPQGKKECYRVTFYDGRSTVVSREHLWTCFNPSWEASKSKDVFSHDGYNGWKVIDTDTMKKYIDNKNRLYIPIAKPQTGPDVDLPLDPYTLGVFIGDGSMSSDAIGLACGHEDKSFIVDRLRADLPEDHFISESKKNTVFFTTKRGVANVYREIFHRLGFQHKRSYEKFIPREYLLASFDQRMELLRGLMDTDGYAPDVVTNGTGGVQYCTTSPQLAEDVVELIRSVGGMVKVREFVPTYTHNGMKKQGRLAYVLMIRMKVPNSIFWLPRKKDRLKGENQYSEKFKLAVKSVEEEGVFDATCIEVDNDSKLYQIEEYIVTHNTFCALASMEKLKVRTSLMLLPKYFGIWDEAFQDIFSGSTIDQMEVTGSGALKKLMKMRKSGEHIPSVLKISVPTYRNYIKSYEQGGLKGLELDGYLVPPHQFHEFMGIGLQINDEIQDDPGFYFKSDTVTNVKKQVYLSATPYTGNDRLSEMINVMLPKRTDAPLPGLDAYANCIGMYYQDNCRPSDYKGFKGAYSHMTYEAGLLKDTARRAKYFKMVAALVQKLYVNDYQPGQKIIIFCATVKFILKLVKHLKHEFKDFNVGEYVSGTDYKDLLNNDITVTTLKSAGAGVDIPNVKEILLLHAINSKRDNIQALGRGRRLKDFPDVNPRFTFVASITIPEHLRYAKQKEIYFHKRIRSLKYYRY